MRTFSIQIKLFVLFFGFVVFNLKAQNLVVNPSFELTSSNCGNFGGEGYTTDLLNWDDANSGADSCSSPDLFSACNTIFGSPAPTNMPNSVLGYQYARTGTRHAGIILHEALDQYREYIEGTTTTPLVAGQQYCVSMYVSLANNVRFACNNIGVKFYNSLFQRNACPGTTNSLISLTPDLNYTCTPIMDTANWVRLEWSYTAIGGEQYFVIGNFYNNAGTTIVNNPGGSMINPYAYYYFDDVSIIPGTCCNADITKVPTQCSNASAITLTATPGLGASCTQTVSGTWSGTGITNASTGVFNPSVAGSGVHTVSLTLSCGFTAVQTITVSPCNLTLCHTGSLVTVSGGSPAYTWQAQTTFTDCSGCPGGNCIPIICPGVVTNTWTTVASNTNTFNVTSLPIKVFDSAGNTFTITNLSSLPTCTVTASCPTLTMSVSSQTNVNCFGALTGSATVSTAGGTGPYTYTWMPGNLNGASQTGLGAGTYTIGIKDANQCAGTGTLVITQPTSSLSAIISATTAAGCGGGTATAVFWTEEFGTGCSQGALASAFTGTNGAWAVTNTGTNDASANQWYVSATESGMTAGSCGDGCLGAGTTNRSLHIANVSTSPAAFIFCPSGDCGAAYDTGIGANNVRTDKRAESPTINCSGQSNITAAFNYIEGGEAALDDATFWYFDGSTWTQIDNMPKTTTCGGGQGMWAARTVTLPASANNNVNVKVGFRWVNNDNGAGSDPSFAVDAITLTGSGGSGGTGAATVTASGGTASYSYNWTPSGGSSATATGLNAGTYTVTVTDNKGCTASAVANITSAGGPTLTVSSFTNVNCFGANTGTATINPTGGTGPYTYTWSPGNLSGVSQNALPAGTYTINVKDANQCIGSTTLTISQPTAALSALISNTVSASCGSSNGSATVTASGGTSGYTYSWSPSGGNSSSASNLASGNNTVLITDAKGCTVTAVANITSTGGPTLSITSFTNVNCFGANTGTATVNATGGSGPYTYTWNPGNLSGASQNSLSAGVYTINVSDANTCSGSGTLSITQPTAALGGAISNTVAPGCGLSNGSASVTANGGTPGYSYSWSPNGGTGTSVTNLTSGSNAVTITDSKGCTTTIPVVLSTPGGPTLTLVSQANVKCFGANTGTASVNASGGTGSYSYTWAPGNLSGASQTALSAGIYTVLVNDANQCSGTTTVQITQPTSSLSLNISSTAAGCGTNNGSATVTATGGTPGYTYTWSPSGGNNSVATNLAAGNYAAIVTDANGCQNTTSVNISSSGGGPTLTVSSQTNITCFGNTNGAASITATGTGPFTYTWTPSGGNASSATNLSAGVYTVTVGNGSACTSSTVVSISQPAAIAVNVSTSDANCGSNDGYAIVNPSGGTGAISVLWQDGTTSNTISAIPAGSYSVLVTDANGCTATATAVIQSQGGLFVDAGIGTTILSGETTQLSASAPFGATISWSPSGSLGCSTCANTSASPQVTTTYTVVATLNGCSGMDTITISVDIICGDLFVPTAFSPNGDGQNDILYVYGNCIETMEFAIFDRWGEKVFETTDPKIGWDGMFNGKKLNPAGFAYYLNATVKGEVINKKGNISLVK
jgi:gliding motility-associated-like protein